MIEFIFTMFLLIGSHETGHQIEADRLNVPIQWHGRTATYTGATDKEMELITNSAFVKQDAVGYALGDPKYWKANGVYKLTYLLRNDSDMDNITTKTKGFIGLSGFLNFKGYDVRVVQMTKNTTGIVTSIKF